MSTQSEADIDDAVAGVVRGGVDDVPTPTPPNALDQARWETPEEYWNSMGKHDFPTPTDADAQALYACWVAHQPDAHMAEAWHELPVETRKTWMSVVRTARYRFTTEIARKIEAWGA